MKHIAPIAIIISTIVTACQPEEQITVAAYYFPNYHEDHRNASYFEEGWTEWELVKKAQPRFPNHHQPNVPAWGYTDEADPVQMAQKIKAAAEHGIDVFIFDWYMYEDGPFLDRCIDEGFLEAETPTADDGLCTADYGGGCHWQEPREVWLQCNRI